MRNVENFGEACDKKDVEIAFARCLKAQDDYFQFLDDAEMKLEAPDA